jgi:hypothetical protein
MGPFMMFTQLTEAHHDNFVIYQVQGMTPEQIELMQRLPFHRQPAGLVHNTGHAAVLGLHQRISAERVSGYTRILRMNTNFMCEKFLKVWTVDVLLIGI